MAIATRTALSELTDFVEMTYGVPRLDTRILVSTYLPTRYPPLWLMIDSEKCRFLEDLEWAVRKLEFPAILDTWVLKKQRAHLANKYVKILMTARKRKPQLFANRYWDWPGPSITRRSWYQLVAAECLRLRLTYNASKQPGSLARDGIYELMRRALAEAAVDQGGIVPRELTETMYRRAQIVPMIDRDLISPTAFMRNLGFVLMNHAAICGRTEPNEDDYGVQRYVLRYCIPLWMEKIIQVLMAHGRHAFRWRELIHMTGQVDEFHWQYGGGDTSNAMCLAKRILTGFKSSGLLQYYNNGRGFSIKSKYMDDLAHIMEARA